MRTRQAIWTHKETRYLLRWDWVLNGDENGPPWCHTIADEDWYWCCALQVGRENPSDELWETVGEGKTADAAFLDWKEEAGL